MTAFIDFVPVKPKWLEKKQSDLVMTATHILCFTSCLKGHDDTVGVLITDVLDLTEFLRLKNQNERSIIKYSVQLPFNI